MIINLFTIIIIIIRQIGCTCRI